MTTQTRTKWATDREGNEITFYDPVTIETDDMYIVGFVIDIDGYRVQVQPNDDSYIWVDESDVRLA